MGLDKATSDVAMQGAPNIEINNICCGWDWNPSYCQKTVCWIPGVTSGSKCNVTDGKLVLT